MARTKKGSKGPGAEYWGIRPAGKVVLRRIGKKSKVLTARRSRRAIRLADKVLCLMA